MSFVRTTGMLAKGHLFDMPDLKDIPQTREFDFSVKLFLWMFLFQNTESTSRTKPKWITDFVIMSHFNKIIVGTGYKNVLLYSSLHIQLTFLKEIKEILCQASRKYYSHSITLNLLANLFLLQWLDFFCLYFNGTEIYVYFFVLPC